MPYISSTEEEKNVKERRMKTKGLIKETKQSVKYMKKPQNIGKCQTICVTMWNELAETITGI